MTKTLLIPVENKADFENTTSKFNKKLIKNSINPITFTYVENIYYAEEDRTVVKTVVEFPEITNLKGEDEYHFYGTIEEIDGNIAYNAINCDAELFRNAEIKCECCGKKIDRTKSIVMSNIKTPTKVNDLKFFGSVCAQQFFTINFEYIYSVFEMFLSACEDEGWCDDEQRPHFRKTSVKFDDLLAAVAETTNDFTTYTSMESGGSDCTKLDVIDLLEKWNCY